MACPMAASAPAQLGARSVPLSSTSAANPIAVRTVVANALPSGCVALTTLNLSSLTPFDGLRVCHLPQEQHQQYLQRLSLSLALPSPIPNPTSRPRVAAVRAAQQRRGTQLVPSGGSGGGFGRRRGSQNTNSPASSSPTSKKGTVILKQTPGKGRRGGPSKRAADNADDDATTTSRNPFLSFVRGSKPSGAAASGEEEEIKGSRGARKQMAAKSSAIVPAARPAPQNLPSAQPAEVAASPSGGGIFGGLMRLPFSGLFRGRRADPATVFVAGAAGLTGSRIVVELLAAGFSVRAGVEDLGLAQRLAEVAVQYELITSEAAKRLNFVQCSAADPEFTAKAIANAARVIVAIGPGENGPGAPPLSPQQGLAFLQATQLAKAPSFILISDFSGGEGGGNSGGSRGGGLFDRLWSFLAGLGGKQGSVQFDGLVDAVVDSGVRFTIVRTGSTEGVPESYAATSSLVLAPEGTLKSAGGGTISRLQVGKLVAELLSNMELAEGKIFDAVVQEGAEGRGVAEQLQAIPLDGRRATKEAARAKEAAQAKEKEFRKAAEVEARAVAAEAKAAAESLAALESEAKKVAAEEAKAAAAAARAQQRAAAATASVADIADNLKQIEAGKGAGAAGEVPEVKSVISSFASILPKIPPPSPSPAAATAAGPPAAAVEDVWRLPLPSTSSGTQKLRKAVKQQVEQ